MDTQTATPPDLTEWVIDILFSASDRVSCREDLREDAQALLRRLTPEGATRLAVQLRALATDLARASGTSA